jgi:psiF repeat
MRRSTWLVVIGAALAFLAGQAAFAQASQPSSQQEKMTTCNADAKAKGLQGTERKAFMKSCLSEKGAAATPGASTSAAGASGSAAPIANSQQQKMKSCNADAKSKGLKGADRKAFMKSCLSGSAAH